MLQEEFTQTFNHLDFDELESHYQESNDIIIMDKPRNIAILDLVRMIRKELHPFTFPSQNLHFVDIGLVDINNKPEIDRVYDWKMLHETDLNAEKIVEAG